MSSHHMSTHSESKRQQNVHHTATNSDTRTGYHTTPIFNILHKPTWISLNSFEKSGYLRIGELTSFCFKL